MRSGKKIFVSLALALALALSAVPAEPEAAAAFTPRFSTARIGLFTFKNDGNIDQRTFPSANLQNVNGRGYGYELGYFNDRDFVSLGGYITDTDEITMLKDRNMVYDSNTNSYSEGTEGGTVVGCFHLRLAETYDNYAAARAVADTLNAGFVRYKDGYFQVLMGQYTSESSANQAAQGAGMAVDSGSSYTVCVVQTRTNRILFEFDCGSSRNLAVRPLANGSEDPITWFKGYTYRGSFAYLRNTGGNLSVVNYVDVEDYVKGVVPWEMVSSWPLEALKAQAITARTYLMANASKHRSEGFDICNTTHCQAYHGTSRANANTDASATETAGQYLTYKGELCETYYTSSDGGATEDARNVWSEDLEYLRGVQDPYERDIAGSASEYYWTRTFTPKSLGEQLRNKGLNSSDVASVDMTFTDMGNVYSITFTDVNGKRNTVSKSEVRTIIGGRSIRYTLNGTGPTASKNIFVNNDGMLPESLTGIYVIGSGGVSAIAGGDVYAISGSGSVDKVQTGVTQAAKNVKPNSEGKFVFSGTGYGHNVGMSQWGAYSMAKFHNKTCEEILTFYYTGTEVVKTYAGT